MVCGKSVEEDKRQKTDWYMERSTPRSEPAYITTLRRQAYENGLNAGVCFSQHPLCRRLQPVMAPKSLPPQQFSKRHRALCAYFRTQTIKAFTLIFFSYNLKLYYFQWLFPFHLLVYFDYFVNITE